MAIHPNTLKQGFNLGVLDHTGYFDAPVIPYGQGMYLNNAMQGNLYQQYGMMPDSFQYTANTPSLASRQPIGFDRNSGYDSFGFNPIGSQGVAGSRSFGFGGIGSDSKLSLGQSMGGFGDVNEKIPTVISPLLKGIAALGIAFTSIALLFKGKKVPQKY